MGERIRVRLERSGGLLGQWPALVLDSADLSPSSADALSALVDPADLQVASGFGVVADDTEYHLQVTIGSRHWDLRMRELDVPVSLRALLKYVQRHGKPG